MTDPPSPRTVQRKIPTETFIDMFRMAARHHGEMMEAKYNENMGAIHSAERILNILGQRLVYPALSHGNNLRRCDWADRSIGAQAAISNGSAVKIEHVSPIRDFTRQAISLIKNGASDDDLKAYVKEHYQLVLLTPDEALRLNKINRSKMTPNRLADADIKLAPRP